MAYRIAVIGGDGTGPRAAAPRHPGGTGKAVAKAIGAYGEASAAAKSSSEALRVEVRAQASVRQSPAATAASSFSG